MLRSAGPIPIGTAKTRKLDEYFISFLFAFSINGHGKLDLFPQNIIGCDAITREQYFCATYLLSKKEKVP